jgi:hypothetical protein
MIILLNLNFIVSRNSYYWHARNWAKEHTTMATAMLSICPYVQNCWTNCLPVSVETEHLLISSFKGHPWSPEAFILMGRQILPAPTRVIDWTPNQYCMTCIVWHVCRMTISVWVSRWIEPHTSQTPAQMQTAASFSILFVRVWGMPGTAAKSERQMF